MTQEQSGRPESAVGAAGQNEQPASEQSPAEQSPAEQAIAADIERTRAELGETVQQLADKAHVGARARHAAADVRERAAQAVRSGTGRAAHAAMDLRDRAADAVPGPVRQRAKATPATVRRYWAQLTGGAAVLALAVLAVRKLRK
jgi:Protein of unknown function (DUF3618)